MASGSYLDAHSDKTHTTSESITLRFAKEILDTLREEAQSKEVSLNTLVSQIMTEHVAYGMNAPKAGLVPLSKGAVKKLLEGRTEEEISTIAKISARGAGDIVYLLRGEFSVEAAVDVWESWLKATGFHYTRTKHSGRLLFVVQHDMGKEWSIYLSEYMKHVMHDLGKTLKIKKSDNIIAAEFELG